MLASDSDSQDDDESGEDLFDEDDNSDEEEESIGTVTEATNGTAAPEGRISIRVEEVQPETDGGDEVEIIRVERQPPPATETTTTTAPAAEATTASTTSAPQVSF